MKLFSILFFALLLACSPELNISQSHYLTQNEKLVSTSQRTKLVDEGAILNNLVVKHQLDHDILYLMGYQSDEVSAYHLNDSSYQSYKYTERSVKISDFNVGSDKIFLLSANSKSILVLSKTDGTFLEEISLDVQKFIVEGRMGESLFHFNEKDNLFYIGLKASRNATSIELVGAFNISGQLEFTFGDFVKDNEEAEPGYLLSNDGIRSQLSASALYILKKETSNLYQFDLDGKLSESQILEFIKIPKREKMKVKGKSVMKDQVMDFLVDENNQEMVYTFFTNTGEYMGEKTPDIYLAYKKFKADTISYTQVDFFKLMEFSNNTITSIPINRDSESRFVTTYKIYKN